MNEEQPDHLGPVVVPADRRPAGHRSVPLLGEHQLDHYPEFRDFFVATFSLDTDPFGPPGLVRVGRRFYELVFVGYSGRPFPAGLRISALVPGLEPLDEEQADDDLWALLMWLVGNVGGEWTTEALATTGRIYRVRGAASESGQ
jgi:hypothetical protein